MIPLDQRTPQYPCDGCSRPVPYNERINGFGMATRITVQADAAGVLIESVSVTAAA
jgi:hypothetical protein